MTQQQTTPRWGNAALVGLAIMANAVELLLAVYISWGWTTVADMQSYYKAKNLDFEEEANGMISGLIDVDGQRTNPAPVMEPKPLLSPISRWLVPVFTSSRTSTQIVSKADQGRSTTNVVLHTEYFAGTILEPFIGISQSSRSGLFALGVGGMTGTAFLLGRLIKNRQVTILELWIRFPAGAIGGLLAFLLVSSGGRLLWPTAGGVSIQGVVMIAISGAWSIESTGRFAGLPFGGRSASGRSTRD